MYNLRFFIYMIGALFFWMSAHFCFSIGFSYEAWLCAVVELLFVILFVRNLDRNDKVKECEKKV